MLKAAPGHKAKAGIISIYWRPSWLSILPQLGTPGGTPKPRKLRLDSIKIAAPTCIEKRIMTIAWYWADMPEKQFPIRTPIALAASIYTFSFKPITALRITVSSNGARYAIITIIWSILTGYRYKSQQNEKSRMEIQASTNLWKKRSNLPPDIADIEPMPVEKMVCRALADSPIMTETRAP